MKKIFLLAVVALFTAGAMVQAGTRQAECKQCAKKHCTSPCPACPNGTCGKH